MSTGTTTFIVTYCEGFDNTEEISRVEFAPIFVILIYGNTATYIMTMTMAHRRPLPPPPQSHHRNNNENDCDADTLRVLEDEKDDEGDDDEDDGDSARKRRTTTTSYNNTLPNQRKQSVLLQLLLPVVLMSAAATLSVVALLIVVYFSVQKKYLTVVFWLRLVVFVPVYLCLYTGVRHTMARMRTVVLPPHHRRRSSSPSAAPSSSSPPPPPMKKILLPLTLIVTVGSAQLPPYLGAALAAAAIIAFSIVTRPARFDTTTSSSHVASSSNNSNNSYHHHHRSNVTFATVVRSIITMIAVMLVENFLIWVVSATFVPGQSATTAPPPLQDNGQRVLNYLFHTLWQLPPSKSTIVSLRRLLNTQWSLVACVGTSFVVTELYDRRRTLYGIANRALRTVAVARFIRTVAFILTVVPSQNPNCYRQRGFPVPPPRQWIDWIWIGIIPRSHGGCNDLIVSGHATIISTCEYCFFWRGDDAYCVGWCPTHYRLYFPQNLNVAPHFALGPHQWPVFPHPSPMT